MVLAFPPNEFYFLGFIMFLPLMFILVANQKKMFWAYYLSMFIYQVGTNWWIAAIQEGKDPWLVASGVALAIGHPFFLMLPLIFLQVIRKRLLAKNPEQIIWLFPIVWIGFEWLHSLTDFSYPWLSVGYTQILNSSWVQMADIGGIWLVGLVLGYANVFMYKYLVSFRSGELLGRRRLKYLAPLAAVVILPLIYGLNRYDTYSYDNIKGKTTELDIALVQPNINPWLKWEGLTPQKQVSIHQNLIDSLVESGYNLDLAIWSESVITNYSYRLNVEHRFDPLRRHMDKHDYSLLTGFADIYYYKDGDEVPAIAKVHPTDPDLYYDTYNAAVLIDRNDKIEEIENPKIYHKMKLTPFAERFPHAEVFWFMRDLVKWGVGISGWQKGKLQTNLIYQDSISIAPIICIESIYPDFVTGFTNQGADIFTIITNDAWYDGTIGPEQHYQIAKMRAIENRKFIARVANTGVSGLIGPNGEDIDRVEQYVSAAKVVSVPTLPGDTVYTIIGGFIGLMSLVVSSIFIILAFVFGQSDINGKVKN